jgi:predicted transcriptional regulator
MADLKHLSELQLLVMRALWQLGEATVAEVHQAVLTERKLALTTVGTLLSRLEASGIVKRRMEDRRNLYSAGVSQDAVRESMLASLLDNLFQGDVTEIFSRLVKKSQVTPSDLEAIRALLDQYQDKAND